MTDMYSSGIRPVIDNWLTEKSKEQRDYGPYWPASSAGYCMRRVIFERLKVPYVTEDARKQRLFSSGHLFHQWAQSITKEAGISIAQELELQDEDLMIRGHIDDLVMVSGLKRDNPLVAAMSDEAFEIYKQSEKETQHLILYDYKTAHSRWFEYKRTEGISYYHKYQLGTYMYMMRNSPPLDYNEPASKAMVTSRGREVTEARILHISKDDLRLAETILFWADDLEKEIKDYWTTLNKYWTDKKIPSCTCHVHENGFLAKQKWNPYYAYGEPCSLQYYQEWKKTTKEKVLA